MDWLDKLTKYAPHIALAFATGGTSALKSIALSTVAKAVGRAINTEADLEKFVMGGDANAVLKLKNAEYQYSLAMEQIQAERDKQQAEINKIDQASGQFWQSGWRPGIGWTCTLGMFLQFILFPIFDWIMILAGIDAKTPQLDGEYLMAMISGMLGIATMRSIDKAKGTDTKP